MAEQQIETNDEENASTPASKRRVLAFCIIVIAWVSLDQLTKSLFANETRTGIIAGPFFGLIDFRIVHNTGGAWGIFSDSTTALAIFSLIVCALFAAYFFYSHKDLNVWATVGIALIVAGGIGNAIDRLVRTYVIDFIEFSFFDFPVFNVADIGVTCGFVLLIIGLLTWGGKADEKEPKA